MRNLLLQFTIIEIDCAFNFRPLSQNEEKENYTANTARVSVLLCTDILLEVLRYLNRCQIIKLEAAGGRIHRIVVRYLGNEPYITRFLQLKPGFLFLSYIVIIYSNLNKNSNGD